MSLARLEANSLIPCVSTGKATDEHQVSLVELKFLSKPQEDIRQNDSGHCEDHCSSVMKEQEPEVPRSPGGLSERQLRSLGSVVDQAGLGQPHMVL